MLYLYRAKSIERLFRTSSDWQKAFPDNTAWDDESRSLFRRLYIPVFTHIGDNNGIFVIARPDLWERASRSEKEMLLEDNTTLTQMKRLFRRGDEIRLTLIGPNGSSSIKTIAPPWAGEFFMKFFKIWALPTRSRKLRDKLMAHGFHLGHHELAPVMTLAPVQDDDTRRLVR